MANDFTTKNSCGVQAQYYWKKKAKFPHPVGIVIGSGVTLGMNCKIYQNVTLGGKGDGEEQPVLGDNVTIYANAVIAGGVIIGDNAVVGANSLVLADVPANETVAGIPAKVLSK
mgnify:CR=1 FL=1